MEFRKTTVPVQQSPEGPIVQVEGFDIPIEESTERYSDVRMADGTQFRVKLSIGAVVRLIDKHDEHGNAIYFVSGSPSVTVLSYGPGATKGGK